MFRKLIAAALPALALSTAAFGQRGPEIAPITGTRLDVSASGEISRVPDVVRINATVTTQARTAGEAMQQNRARMDRVRAALTAAGFADRDIQTRDFSLRPVHHTPERQPTVLVGYAVRNQLLVRFRDVNASGPALDALVAEGVTEIDGPILAFDQPERLIEEARALAARNALAQAELYAAEFGLRIKRVVSIQEGGADVYQPMSSATNMIAPVGTDSSGGEGAVLDPGGRSVRVSLDVVFELERGTGPAARGRPAAAQ